MKKYQAPQITKYGYWVICWWRLERSYTRL